MIRFAILAACIAIPVMAQTMTIQPSTPAPATETRTFALQSGGRLRIINVNGDISISAWDKDEVALTASFKSNSKGEHVRLDVDSDVDLLELIAKINENNVSKPASCDMELKVPSRVLSNINTVNGTITLNAIAGKNLTNSVNGDIVLKNINGTINASVVNGEITGSVQNIEDNLNLSAVNGDIKVELLKPKGNLHASSVHGSVKIPSGVKNVITLNNGKNITTKFDGNANMKFGTVNGSITILIPGF